MKKLISAISLCLILVAPLSVSASSIVGSTFPQQLIDTLREFYRAGEQTYDLALQTYDKYSKEVLNPLMRQLAALVIIRMQETTLTWIRSGFHGAGPAFIVNPDVYFKNVANEAIAPQLQSIQRDVGNIFGGSVIGQTIIGIRGLRSMTSSQLRYTLGNSIQASLCNQQNLKQMAIQDIDAGLYVGPKTNNRDQQIAYKQTELYNQLCLHQAEGNRVLQQNLTSCFAKNFSCGGWDAWLGLTNPNNTAYGQATRASILINQKAQQAVKQTADQFVNGLMPKTKCVEYAITNDDEGNPIPEDQRVCTKTEVVTPAASVANALLSAQQSGIQQAANTDGPGLQSLMSALVTGMLQRAMEGIAKTGNSGYNSSNAGTLTLDANGKLITVYGNTTPVNTGGPVVQIPTDSAAPTPLIRQLEKGIVVLGRIKNVLDMSSALLSSYDTDIKSLEQCYNALPTSDSVASSIQMSGRSYISRARATYVPYLKKIQDDQAQLVTMTSQLDTYKRNIVKDQSLDNVSKILTEYTTAVADGAIFNEPKEMQLKAEYDQYKKQSDDDRAANLNPKLQECRQYLPPD